MFIAPIFTMKDVLEKIMSFELNGWTIHRDDVGTYILVYGEDKNGHYIFLCKYVKESAAV